jgi:hypothetical protein
MVAKICYQRVRHLGGDTGDITRIHLRKLVRTNQGAE